MKKFITTLLMISLLINTCVFALQTSAYAASANVVGFPLPAKTTPYNVNVLSHYSGGSKHTPYIYEYGPLKGKTLDLNIVMDIGVSVGTEVYSVADGHIRTVEYGNSGGHYVVINHYDGSYSYYGHLKQKSILKKGSRVVAGQLIGYSGDTGNSTGPHLHFEWSGHDPFCLYEAKGLVKIKSNSGASKYPHTHKNPYITENTQVSSNTCSHKYTGGICQKCKYEFPYKVTSLKAAAYKVTNSSGAQTWSRPYSNNSKKINKIKKNSYVVVIAKTENQAGKTWYLLSDRTWVFSGNVKSCSMPKNVRYVKSASGLNLRSGPKTSYKVLAEIPNGGLVIVNPSKKSGTWIYVSYPAKGISGWVSSNYLTTTAPKY